jgi:hypothetical protein
MLAFTRVLKISRICYRRCCRWLKQNRTFPLSPPVLDTRNPRANGVRFYRLQPDDVRVELVAAWKKANPSVVLRAFLELIDTNAAQIRSKAELH